MFFKHKQKNRRQNRRHVLDVKLRSDQVRATRMRLATAAFALVFGTVFGLYLFWCAGKWALDKFVYENSDFAIRQIDVQTDGRLSQEQVRRWCGVKDGQNLIALDLATVKRNLQLVTAINSISVERALPRTLKIRVTGREAIAQVNVPRADATTGIYVSIFQLDTNGFVMQPMDPGARFVPLAQMNEPLPVVTGLNIFKLQPGRRLDAPQALAALELISDFKNSAMNGQVQLQRIDVSAPGVITVTTMEGAEITFGLGNFPQQLARWRAIYDFGQQMNKAIASADLAVANNVPVHWAGGISAPEATPGNSNQKNSRRKNV